MKIRHKDFELAKKKILERLDQFIYAYDQIEVPAVFLNSSSDYKVFTVRSAIIGGINKLERMVFEERSKKLPKIKELDVIEVKHNIKKHNLKKGDSGAVVHVHDYVKAYEVEFVKPDGRTVGVFTLTSKDIIKK